MKKKTAKKKDEELEKTKQYKIKGKKKNSNKKEKVDLKSMSKQERKAYKKQKRKKSKVRKFFLGFFLILFLLIVIALGIFAGLFFGDTWAIDEKYLTINTANSIVYDREGNVICELNGNENRKIISMEDMSPYLPQAFIAIEDKRFYAAVRVKTFILNRNHCFYEHLGNFLTCYIIRIFARYFTNNNAVRRYYLSRRRLSVSIIIYIGYRQQKVYEKQPRSSYHKNENLFYYFLHSRSFVNFLEMSTLK